MRHPYHHRFALQLVIAFAACVPVMAGILGMVSGKDMLGIIPNDTNTLNLDSHIRYLSGILFAIGFVFWSLIPRIEQKTREVRLMTLLVFIGGMARLYAALFIRVPSTPMLLAIVMELGVTPALCFWQIYLSKNWPSKAGV